MAAGVAVAFRLALAFFLLSSGIRKSYRPRAFATAVKGYGLLPNVAVSPVAIGVPLAELVLGACLALGIAPLFTALALTLFLGLFIAAMAANLRRGQHIPCGCYGLGETSEVSAASIVRNAALIILALAAGLLVIGTADATNAGLYALQEQITTLRSASIYVALGVLWSVSIVYLLEWAVATRQGAQATLATLREGRP